MSKPIVCCPQEAYRCFQATHMVLVMGSHLLLKEEQPGISNSFSK